jgi:hypothetical protein
MASRKDGDKVAGVTKISRRGDLRIALDFEMTIVGELPLFIGIPCTTAIRRSPLLEHARPWVSFPTTPLLQYSLS